MQEEDYCVQVQKKGGPFRIYYNYVPSPDDLTPDERSEFATSFYVSVLKDNDRVVTGFTCNDVDKAYNCMLQAEAYIANELRKNYPEYLVPETAVALSQHDVIPVGLVKTIAAEQLDYFSNDINGTDLKTLYRLSDDEIEMAVIRKTYEKEFNQIAAMEKSIRQRESALIGMRVDYFYEKAPKWYELKKQYEHITQKIAIDNETKKIERMEAKCKEQEQSLCTQGRNNNLVQEETKMLMGQIDLYRKLAAHNKTVETLKNKLDRLADTTLIPFSVGNEPQKINSSSLLKAVEKYCTHKIAMPTPTKEAPSKTKDMSMNMSM